MTKALGLIEVVGFVVAIQGADSALKAANVKLVGVEKVGSGILTVQLMGDVGAVTAAVEAGTRAAQEIGPFRSSHIIPRVDESLFGVILDKKGNKKKEIKQEMVEIRHDIEKEKLEAEKIALPDVVIEDKIMNKNEPYTLNELNKMSNSSLRELVKELGIFLSEEKQKSLKKQDLIALILEKYND